MFRLKVMSGDGTACSGNVQYGVSYGLFSSDGVNRLDIGETGAGTMVFWDENSVSTRLHINPAA